MIARIGLVLILVLMEWAFGTVTPAETSHGWTHNYTACITEDSPGPCYWDATKHGNRKGRSFVVNSDQKVIFISER